METINAQESKNLPKPPPIYVSKVENAHPLKYTLEAIVSDHYEIKVLRADEIKIQPKNIESYHLVKKNIHIYIWNKHPKLGKA